MYREQQDQILEGCLFLSPNHPVNRIVQPFIIKFSLEDPLTSLPSNLFFSLILSFSYFIIFPSKASLYQIEHPDMFRMSLLCADG
jgi:hypothetical protein